MRDVEYQPLRCRSRCLKNQPQCLYLCDKSATRTEPKNIGLCIQATIA